MFPTNVNNYALLILLGLNVLQFFRNQYLTWRKNYFEKAFRDKIKQQEEKDKVTNQVTAENERHKEKVRELEAKIASERPSDPWILRDSPDELRTPATDVNVHPSGRRDSNATDDKNG